MPEEQADAVRQGVVAALERLRDPDGRIVMIATVRYTVARRAAENV